jgi:general L-amino acid transport system permease protein
MSSDFGYTVQPQEGGGEIMHALAEADAPRHGDQSPGQWAKSNLFNTWYNAIITVVFGAIALWAGYYVLRFVFVTARWEPVSENLELFMVGTFPREEIPRIVGQVLLTSGAVGLAVGWAKARARLQAEESGSELIKTDPRDLVSSYSAIVLFVVACLVIGVRTIDPVLLVIGCVVGGVVGFLVTLPLRNPFAKLIILTPIVITAIVLSQISGLNNGAAYALGIGAAVLLAIVNLTQSLSVMLSAALLMGVSGFQILSGSGGVAWLFVALSLLPVTFDLLTIARDRLPSSAGWIGVAILAIATVWRIAIDGFGVIPAILLVLFVFALLSMLRGDGDPGLRFAAFTIVAVLSWAVTNALDVSGIDWEEWSGLQLNIVVASASIVLAFPVGLVLALSRRSSLPVLRWLATVYIEVIRGIPLISLLLMGQFFIGFFLATDDPLSNVTRATAAITMFSAAYIAEIVRGGLQSVDKGQTEAGQALGLPAAKITRLLVLPQALRNVIPAMVGQFISLFKDTTLLSIIGITEFLGIREIVHAQEDFRGFGIAETLVFVAFGFWAVSFTMSRESQRLERRLGVGVR